MGVQNIHMQVIAELLELVAQHLQEMPTGGGAGAQEVRHLLDEYGSGAHLPGESHQLEHQCATGIFKAAQSADLA